MYYNKNIGGHNYVFTPIFIE